MKLVKTFEELANLYTSVKAAEFELVSQDFKNPTPLMWILIYGYYETKTEEQIHDWIHYQDLAIGTVIEDVINRFTYEFYEFIGDGVTKGRLYDTFGRYSFEGPLCDVQVDVWNEYQNYQDWYNPTTRNHC